MARTFTTQLRSDGQVEILCDPDTFVLIKDALAIIRPDESSMIAWSEDCATSADIFCEAFLPGYL